MVRFLGFGGTSSCRTASGVALGILLLIGYAVLSVSGPIFLLNFIELFSIHWRLLSLIQHFDDDVEHRKYKHGYEANEPDQQEHRLIVNLFLHFVIELFILNYFGVFIYGYVV